ncbi:alpha-L-rhamnosidase [Bifidobacterium eulemuris]|uniref:alpha-L-rhamnosidase n=1 Tax=Bifidobacterium eulemuris TaxID=1765219 RepID=A0A261G1I8_9BIFI|nr:alpha-L-rhamnosidase [Bifidobacterium eulemuris]OZG65033.1 alfa-L-rhamnosidase [Bifidobacterium eulemuris]QOL32852.1 family 78 glycoside hydrolase catalytic domain [Bifidobacterium eulemuris]
MNTTTHTPQIVPAVTAGDLDITRFTVEHYPGDALGIGTAAPRMSWVYAKPVPEDAQILLKLTRRVPGGEPVELETYLPVADSVLVPWQFEPLVSREEVYATVQVVSASHQPLGDPSETLHFEAGLLLEHDHVADFVGPSWAEPQSDHRHLPLVRTEVDLRDKPSRARLYLSALGLVEAEINGVKVGNDALIPGWTNYERRVECWTYDVADALQAGGNALGFWLGDGWFRGRVGFDGGYANYYGDRIGVFAQLEVEYADGVTEAFYSNSWDRRWKAALGPIVCSDLCEGERYDARLERPGWSEPGFDDSDWAPVAEVFYDPANIENPETSPVRAHEEHKPLSITRIDDTAQGRGVWLVDFGQNCSQRIRLHMRGLSAGETVELRHVEVLEPDGTIATRTLRRGQQHDVYTSNGRDAWWEPRFAMHGFRYAQIEGLPGELTADDIECRVYHSVMDRAGELETSDTLLNRLHANAVWSMRSNFVSLPTDCPQRDERLGWTGDICLFAPTASYLYDVQGFLGSWLKDVRADQTKWGTVPFYVPFIPLGVWAHPQAISTWGDAAVEVPWTLYMDSGDTKVLEDSYDLVCDWIDEVAGYLSDDGVWDRKPDFVLGQLGDWLDPAAPPEDPTQAMTEKELVATAFYYRSCVQAQAIARILGRDADAERFAGLRDLVRGGFLARFTKLDGTMTSDTQCAYALTIAFGLLDDEPVRRIKAGNRLAELVRLSGGRVSTGFAGTPFVLPALSITGHDKEAYELLTSTECPSWLYQVRMGATTTWERWDSMREDGTLNPGGMTSFNHYALGSVAEWMHARIGGLEAIEPGWRRFRVSPRVGGGIDHASTSHITPYGKAAVDWRGADDVLELTVAVPVGTTALVEIPDYEPRELGAGEHRLEFRR